MQKQGGSFYAVAANLDRAREIAEVLGLAGQHVEAATDIGFALANNPALVVIEPSPGRESYIQSVLNSFDQRPFAPPAVLVVSDDPKILYSIGAVLDTFSLEWGKYKVVSAVERALALRRNFAAHWPQALAFKRPTDLAKIEYLLLTMAGMKVRSDTMSGFVQIVRERMVANLIHSLRDYESLLQNRSMDKKELEILAVHYSVGETFFWRYSGQMHALQNLLRANPRKQIKIWSAGCSTGEEPYSAAIAVFDALGESANVVVYGTDINPVSLQTAKLGFYNNRSVKNIPSRLFLRWFAEGINGVNDCRVKDEIRRVVKFSELNLCGEDVLDWIKENGPFDAIFCRNVLIYLGEIASRKLVDNFAQGLVESGGFFLGSAERLSYLPEEFEVVHNSGSFYYQKTTPKPHPPVAENNHHAAAPLPPDVALEEYKLGLEALNREDFSGAKRIFEKLVFGDPLNSLGNTGLAIILSNEGREEEARMILNGVIHKGREPAEAHFILGILEERVGENQLALKCYEDTLEKDPEFFMAHINRAWIFKKLNQVNEFGDEMRKALTILKRNPNCPKWVTGGLGVEAVLTLVAQAVDVCVV